MVTNVVTVRPDDTVREAARLLLKHRISGAPVVDDSGRLVGVISEADLIRRVEIGTERRRSSWLELLTGNANLAAEYLKAHARKVEDVMSCNVIVATPNMQLTEIARLLEKHKIKRVPIVEGEKVVGVVSRANLLQALAGTPEKTSRKGKSTDSVIRGKVIARLSKEPWAVIEQFNVTVHDGVVELWGIVGSEQQKEAIKVAAEITPGVRAVTNNLSVGTIVSGL
jgi:CBS domain-containing protein